ncbi:MAG: hypothetical protein LBR36_05700 [Bacteroidales bacterium]|nr:hypothetical protein [Bacteroidales bacterium]
MAEKYHALKAENAKFRSRNKEMRDRISALETKVKSQATELVKFKLGLAVDASNSKADVKRKINALVQQIDKCITLLEE